MANKCVSKKDEMVKHVMVPIACGSEGIDVVTLVHVLCMAGANVTVVSVEHHLQVECMNGVKLVADMLISDCTASHIFDLIVIPGGIPGSEKLRDCKVLEKITRTHAEEGRLYGAVGEAPAIVLEAWGLLKGRQATCHPSFMDQLSSALPVDSTFQVDGMVTTAQGPAVTIDFALYLAEQLYGKQILESVLLKRMVAQGWNTSEVGKEEYNVENWALTKTPQVLVPIASGSDEMEAIIPIDILRRSKANVLVASVEDSLEIVAARGTKIVADKFMKDDESNYDLILLPGGINGGARLASSEKLVKLLREQAKSNKVYGAICTGAVMLDTKGLLKGKKATSHPYFSSEFSDQSAVNVRVVIDGKVITSRGPGTAMEFTMNIVEKVFGLETTKQIAEALVFS